MNKEERKKFLKWHTEQTETFYFEDELRLCCWSDVGILRECIMSLRDLAIEVTTTNVIQGGQAIDSFANITIPSVCASIYKTKYVTEEHEVFVKGLEKRQECKVLLKMVNGHI